MALNTLTYKGIEGAVYYNGRKGRFVGNLTGIGRNMTFGGESVHALRRDFEKTVEAYLRECERRGVAPRKQYSGTFKLRIAPETHRRLALEAAIEGVSLNAYIKGILEKKR